MTAEEVLATFLKQHRKYSAFKRNLDLEDRTVVDFTICIDMAFTWAYTPEGAVYWSDMQVKWFDMCEHFELDYETIDLSKI